MDCVVGNGVKGVSYVEKNPDEAIPLPHLYNCMQQNTVGEATHTGAKAHLGRRQVRESTIPGGDEAAVKTRMKGGDRDRPPVLSGPQILTGFRYHVSSPVPLPIRGIDLTVEGDIVINE